MKSNPDSTLPSLLVVLALASLLTASTCDRDAVAPSRAPTSATAAGAEEATVGEEADVEAGANEESAEQEPAQATGQAESAEAGSAQSPEPTRDVTSGDTDGLPDPAELDRMLDRVNRSPGLDDTGTKEPEAPSPDTETKPEEP